MAQQRRGEFVAKVTARDADVFQDDSAVILLDPAGTGRQAYDFAVNALGTVADARCAGPDLWETREVSWNSGAQARGSIGEDEWSVEVSIPFADLGGVPHEGDTWQAGLGRIARARHEIASWHPARRGFHDPYQLGTLVFAGVGPGVVLTPPVSLQPGKNTVLASLSPVPGRPQGVFLYAATGPGASRARSRAYGFVSLDETAVDLPLTVGVVQEGELQLECGVLDAATLRPLALTPVLPRSVKSSLAQLRLSTDGAYELTVNDESISRGPGAAGDVIPVPLRKGANVFALRLEPGTAAIEVNAPGVRFTAESWVVAAADTKDATGANLDDSSWPLAPRQGEHPQLGTVVGEPGKPVVLRRTLLWEKTRIWPTSEPAFYLARGPAQHFNVMADGLPGRRLDGWTTYLATPPEFEILGSSGFYGTTHASQPRFVCTQLGTQAVNGREMRLVKVTADKSLLAGRHYIMSLFNVFVRRRAEGGEPGEDESEFVYWTEANRGNVSEPPQRFRVRLLPTLAGTGGVLVYDRQSFDGRVWYAVAEVSRLAAAYEEVFLKGKPAQAFPGFGLTQAQVLADGDTTLVCAINQGSGPVEYALRLPAEAGAGTEFYTQKAVSAGEQIACSLAPGDVAVYVLRR